MPQVKISRLTEDVRRELCDVMRQLKDPRISGLISIVKVELTNDLSHCKVYVSSLSGIETAKESVKGLKSAAGYIRREVGSRLAMRHTPEFQFIADDSIEYGVHISHLLREIVPEEEAKGETEE